MNLLFLLEFNVCLSDELELVLWIEEGTKHQSHVPSQNAKVVVFRCGLEFAGN